MSEARLRGFTQNHSKIFSGAPKAQQIRERDIPQSQSKIFEPLEIKPKPMTFAREQYYKTTLNFGDEPTTYKDPPSNCDQSGMSPAGKKSNQNSSTKYLLGNDKAVFYKKSVSSHIGVPADFEPKYTSDSAFDRKQKEFNSGFSPSKEEKEKACETAENFAASARERKLQDRVSVFDSNAYKPQPAPAPTDNYKENKPTSYDPSMRKSEVLSSNVFGERVIKEYKKPQAEAENDQDRRKNHMFSDLFGLSSSPTKKPVEKLQPATHFLHASSKPTGKYNPHEQSVKNLSSSIDIGGSQQNLQKTRPRTPQNEFQPRFQDAFPNPSQRKQHELSTGFQSFSSQSRPELYDFDVRSVPSTFNAPQLKRICEGVHVVALELDIDNFTGDCKGTGRLKVRTHDAKDIENLQRSLKIKGIMLSERQENLGKKTNYSEISNVNWSNPYDYRKSTTPINAREHKMKNLESSLFGEQRKWSGKKVESVDTELLARMQWENTKKASRPPY